MPADVALFLIAAGLFDSVIIDRRVQVTCPVKSGAVFAGVVAATPVAAGGLLRDAQEAALWAESCKYGKFVEVGRLGT